MEFDNFIEHFVIKKKTYMKWKSMYKTISNPNMFHTRILHFQMPLRSNTQCLKIVFFKLQSLPAFSFFFWSKIACFVFLSLFDKLPNC